MTEIVSIEVDELMIRKTIQVDIPSCQQAKFFRCSLAINYHLFNSRIIAPRNR
jgi:hypothetical protein